MTETAPNRRDRLHAVLPVLLVGGLLAAALATGISQEEPDTDEYLYMNMARAVLDGQMPYRDFFSAHMPGVILPSAAVFAVFGRSIPAARIVPAASTVAVFVLCFLIASRIWKESAYPAVFALTFLVTSVNLHAISSTGLGMNLATALTLGGIYCHYCGKPAASGFLLSLTLLVRLGTAPVLLLFLLLSDSRKRFALGAAAPVAALAALVLIPNFAEQTFWYHIDKTGIGFSDRLYAIWSFLWAEKILVAFAAGAVLLMRREKDSRPVVFAAAAILLFAAFQKVVWPYYFNPAIPLLAVLAGGAAWKILQTRVRPEFLFAPNLLLLAIVGAVNLIPIMRGYRDDMTMLPVVDRISAQCRSPDDHFLDLTGGSLGAYVSMKTGIAQTGKHFDFNTQRIATEDVESVVGEVVGLLNRNPRLVVTELESGRRTIIWSKMKAVRALLNRKYHLEDYAYQQSRGRILEYWVLAPEARPSVEMDGAAPGMEVYNVRVALGGGKLNTYDDRVRWGLENESLARFLNDAAPGAKMVSDFAFADTATELLFPEDDLAESKAVTLRWISIAQEAGTVRMLLENFKDSEIFEPVSFIEAVFDRPSGTLRRLAMFSDYEGRFFPTVLIGRSDAAAPPAGESAK